MRAWKSREGLRIPTRDVGCHVSAEEERVFGVDGRRLSLTAGGLTGWFLLPSSLSPLLRPKPDAA